MYVTIDSLKSHSQRTSSQSNIISHSLKLPSQGKVYSPLLPFIVWSYCLIRRENFLVQCYPQSLKFPSQGKVYSPLLPFIVWSYRLILTENFLVQCYLSKSEVTASGKISKSNVISQSLKLPSQGKVYSPLLPFIVWIYRLILRDNFLVQCYPSKSEVTASGKIS